MRPPVLQDVAAGRTLQESANRLGCSTSTVRKYRSKLLTEFQAHGLPDLVHQARVQEVLRHDGRAPAPDLPPHGDTVLRLYALKGLTPAELVPFLPVVPSEVTGPLHTCLEARNPAHAVTRGWELELLNAHSHVDDLRPVPQPAPCPAGMAAHLVDRLRNLSDTRLLPAGKAYRALADLIAIGPLLPGMALPAHAVLVDALGSRQNVQRALQRLRACGTVTGGIPGHPWGVAFTPAPPTPAVRAADELAARITTGTIPVNIWCDLTTLATGLDHTEHDLAEAARMLRDDGIVALRWDDGAAQVTLIPPSPATSPARKPLPEPVPPPRTRAPVPGHSRNPHRAPAPPWQREPRGRLPRNKAGEPLAGSLFLGAALAEQRHRQHADQAEVARQIGSSVAKVSRMERGITSLRWADVECLFTYFGLPAPLAVALLGACTEGCSAGHTVADTYPGAEGRAAALHHSATAVRLAVLYLLRPLRVVPAAAHERHRASQIPEVLLLPRPRPDGVARAQVFLDEGALLKSFGSPHVLADRLDELACAATAELIDVRVVRVAAGLLLGDGATTMLSELHMDWMPSPTLVTAETGGLGCFWHSTGEQRRNASAILDQWATAAESPSESLTLIRYAVTALRAGRSTTLPLCVLEEDRGTASRNAPVPGRAS